MELKQPLNWMARHRDSWRASELQMASLYSGKIWHSPGKMECEGGVPRPDNWQAAPDAATPVEAGRGPCRAVLMARRGLAIIWQIMKLICWAKPRLLSYRHPTDRTGLIGCDGSLPTARPAPRKRDPSFRNQFGWVYLQLRSLQCRFLFVTFTLGPSYNILT